MESSPSVVVNPATSGSNRARESRRRKKKMKTQQSQQHQQSSSSSQSLSSINETQKFSWKSEKTQQIYSSNLLQALQQVRISPSSPSPSPAAPRPSRAVREAADKALAVAARGRTRWSRAILMSRFRLQYLHKKLHKRQRVSATGVNRSPPQRKPILKLKSKGNSLPAVQRKVKTLGRLVPGCRKEGLPVILEEATDYIPALEMQIRAMRGILSLLSTGEGSSAGPTVPENGSI